LAAELSAGHLDSQHSRHILQQHKPLSCPTSPCTTVLER
jgi:hypothetical protein